VVIGCADIRGDDADVAELGERTQELGIGRGSEEASRDLIDALRVRRGEVVAKRAEITDFYDKVAGELALDIETGLVEVAV
jgi:hypothetical protein